MSYNYLGLEQSDIFTTRRRISAEVNGFEQPTIKHWSMTKLFLYMSTTRAIIIILCFFAIDMRKLDVGPCACVTRWYLCVYRSVSVAEVGRNEHLKSQCDDRATVKEWMFVGALIITMAVNHVGWWPSTENLCLQQSHPASSLQVSRRATSWDSVPVKIIDIDTLISRSMV